MRQGSYLCSQKKDNTEWLIFLFKHFSLYLKQCLRRLHCYKENPIYDLKVFLN